MRKIVFVLILIFITACSDNRVLTRHICKTSEQALKCTEGCKISDEKYSNFTFKEDTVMYVYTNYEGNKYIQTIENCKIIDKNNWQCDRKKMFDGVFLYPDGNNWDVEKIKEAFNEDNNKQSNQGESISSYKPYSSTYCAK